MSCFYFHRCRSPVPPDSYICSKR